MVSHYEGIGGNRQKNGLLNLIMCALDSKRVQKTPKITLQHKQELMKWNKLRAKGHLDSGHMFDCPASLPPTPQKPVPVNTHCNTSLGSASAWLETLSFCNLPFLAMNLAACLQGSSLFAG